MGWQKKLEKECLKVPGQHILEIGITGSGKTQGLYWLLDGLINSSDETIVWFDTGKSSEILTLAKFRELNVMIPETFEISIDLNEKGEKELKDIKISYIDDPRLLWLNLDPSRINVISLYPYIHDPEIYAKVFTHAFKSLIYLAHDLRLDYAIPLSIFFDEFHVVAPAQGHGEDGVGKVGSIIQLNIEKLRSLKIRFVATTQGWFKIRKGVRSSFNWLLVRRGGYFSSDQPKLQKFNGLFQTLKNDEAIIVYPSRVFSDVMHLPLYPNGEEFGRVRYRSFAFEKMLEEEKAISWV